MAPQKVVTKVWIEPGCIVCDACETTAPTVFEVTDDTCIIRPEALNPSFTKPITQAIVDAALECPVDVIKYETVAEEVSPALAGKPPVAPAPAAPAKPVTKSPEA
ncbi:MAG: ferredoxin, partial [Planctomycetota bacterium]